MQILMHGSKIKQMHALLNRSLCGMSKKLDDFGVHFVLLKGQGVAQDYAIPEARQCGDLDIWVGNEVYQSVCDNIRKEGYVADYAMAKADKHLEFTFEKSCVEIHRYSATLNYANKNKDFHSWTDECLNASQRAMWVTKDWKIIKQESEDAVKVFLPSATYNTLYIFLHLYHHFIYGGVGLRQLCDWCRCVYVHHHEIDTVELEARLKEFKLFHPWQVFGAMCVEILGMPKEKMPFYTEKYNSKIGRLLSFIEEDGNIGHTSMKNKVRPKNFIAGKFFSLRCQFQRFIALLSIFPKDVMFSSSSYILHNIKVAWVQYTDRH